ncbi:MAG TPA: hypothetical protein VEV43_08975 [Actinomycetota bacterium]|nr:hypothetical protein [Actinomycetota bacterium]
MSLLGYQQALCDLIASPASCLQLRGGDTAVLDGYDLDDRDRRRLRTVVSQRGMSTACTLYRVNRITPIFTLLPLTCFLLGDDLIGEAEAFWQETVATDLQFSPEASRFAAFVRQRIEEGAVDNPYVEEVMELELALNRVNFAGRAERGETRVRFRHDPEALLGPLSRRQLPPEPPAEGEFWVVVDASGPEVELRAEGAG